jgi:hypothetical protein
VVPAHADQHTDGDNHRFANAHGNRDADGYSYCNRNNDSDADPLCYRDGYQHPDAFEHDRCDAD